jgi:hypothetical protein
MSPTARTLAELRKQGWKAQVVEKWIPQTRTRSDLFGIIDILAIRGTETLGVQATSVGNQTARMKKLENSEGARWWLDGGSRRLEVWGWGKKLVKRGGKAVRWTVTIREVG